MSHLKIAIVECSVALDDIPDNPNDSPDENLSIASAVNRLTCAIEGWAHFASRICLPSECTATAFAFLIAEGSDEWGMHDLVMAISDTVILDAAELRNALAELMRCEKRVVIGPFQDTSSGFRYVCWRPRDRHVQKLFISLTANLSPEMTITRDVVMRALLNNTSLETERRLGGILPSINNNFIEHPNFSRFTSRLLTQLASPNRETPGLGRPAGRRFSHDWKK